MQGLSDLATLYNYDKKQMDSSDAPLVVIPADLLTSSMAAEPLTRVEALRGLKLGT